MSESRRRNEAGQTLPMILMFMVCILLFAGLVIDLGQAYRTRIQLQASADAASLAGAARFPDSAVANSTAYQYSAKTGSKNSIPGVPNVAVNVQTVCSKTLPTLPGREHGGGRRDGQRADHVPAADRHQVDPGQGARHGLLAVQRRAAGRDVRVRPDGIDVPGLERQQRPGVLGHGERPLRHDGLPGRDGLVDRPCRPGGVPAGGQHGHEVQYAVELEQLRVQLAVRAVCDRAAEQHLQGAGADRGDQPGVHPGLDDQLRQGRRWHGVRDRASTRPGRSSRPTAGRTPGR